MLRTPVILAFLLLRLHAVAQPAEVIHALATFHSDLERDLFVRVTDTIDAAAAEALMIASDPRAGEADIIRHRSLLKALDEEITPKLGRKDIKGQAAIIFGTVQKRALKHYRLMCSLQQISGDGTYNCLTASTLIGQLLDRHALPYDMQVRPDHVFLIVDPGHANVVLEATDPQGGVYAPDVKAKRALVDRFRRYKLIDGRTTSDVDIDSLVYSDISADTVVTGNGLIGLHYWNSALDYAERNQFDTAIAQFAKSYRLYPKESTLVQLTTTMAASLRENDAEQLDHIERYLQMRLLLSSLHPSIQGSYPKEFYALTEKYLIGQSDSLYHQRAFAFFEAYAPDSASLEAVRFIHHFQMGRYLGLRKQFRGALDELMQARALRPKDLDVNRLLGDCLKGLTGQFYGRPDYKEKVELLLQEHPALAEIDEMRNVRAIGYMSFAFDHFNIDDRKAALKSLGQFETEFDPEHSPLTPEAIATVYYAGWRSYTRAQDHATARRMVEQGLRYAPFSEDLNRVKRYKP